MTERLESELQIECQVWKAKAEIWERAFNKLLVNKCVNNISLSNEDNQEETELQEKQAIDHLENEILPKDGEMGAKGIWVEALIVWIKPLAIELTGRMLEHVAEKGTEWAINGVSFVLLKLQDFLYDKYLLANDKQKEIFKDKILEKFPESGLADKLRNE